MSSPVLAKDVETIESIRFWALGEVTRIAIETSGPVDYFADRAVSPDRVFFDIHNSRAVIDGEAVKKQITIPVGDRRIRQIRIGENRKRVVRVVLDLAADVEFTISDLRNPYRLIIEIRDAVLVAGKSEPAGGAGSTESRTAPAEVSTPPVESRHTAEIPPTTAQTPSVSTPIEKAKTASTDSIKKPSMEAASKRTVSSPGPVAANRVPEERTGVQVSRAPDAAKRLEELPETEAKPAKPNSNGNRSLTRAMGLKVGKIVIDPGHGGHDTGTISPAGLYEKSIVLDIALRLGKLIEDRLGYEVVYTRDEDRFVSLTDRNLIANQSHADLFISIHLNSSSIRSISGTETYFLSLTNSRYALDVAARENASVSNTVYDLQELVQKIALTDKIEESREFALRVQKEMHSGLGKTVRAPKNRGIKKAPFVVLIGARMPAILVEVGFLSNPREESLLRKADHREAAAAAIFDGISSYTSTLSSLDVAKSRSVISSQ